MKNTIKTLAVAIMVIAATASFAQKGGLKETDEKMKTELGLSDEQVAKIQKIRQAGRKERKADGVTDEQKKESAKNEKEKIEKVLTPEQLAKWNKSKADKKKGK